MPLPIDLNLAATTQGAPLSGEARALLTAAIRNPCSRTWDNAKNLVLRPDRYTLWMAVNDVDPGFAGVSSRHEAGGGCQGPGPCERVIPGPRLLIEAINYATGYIPRAGMS